MSRDTVRSLLGVVALLVAGVVPAAGQTVPGATSRVEVSALGLVTTGGDLGASEALLRGNTVPSGSPVRLFQTDTRLAAMPSAEVRVGVRVARAWMVEGGVALGRPRIDVTLSNDLEGADDVTATTDLTHITFDGALVRRWQRGRTAPFVLAGAGYVRQLDAARTTVGTGQMYIAGGGVLYGLGGAAAGAWPRVSLRADIRLVGHRGGMALMDARPLGVGAGVGLTVRVR